jgi:hypothetical protein
VARGWEGAPIEASLNQLKFGRKSGHQFQDFLAEPLQPAGCVPAEMV